MQISRALGEKIPISVSTAIPFEEVITNDAIKKPKFLWMNLETLARNFISVIDRTEEYIAADIAPLFLEELSTIKNLTTMAEMSPVFYLINYSDIKRIFKHNESYKSPAGKLKEQATIKILVTLADRNLREEITIHHFNNSIPANGQDAFIMTHRPIDLLSYRSFGSLKLLESHTGAIKNKTEWLSKLTKNDSYKRIPFNLLSYQVFGDNDFIVGQSVKVRKVLTDLADKRKWNAGVHWDIVKNDIFKIEDADIKKLLIEMSRVVYTKT